MNDTPPMKPDGDPTTLAEAIFDLTESAKTAEHYGVDAHDVSPAAIRIVLTETAALSAALARSEERVKEAEARFLREQRLHIQNELELEAQAIVAKEKCSKAEATIADLTARLATAMAEIDRNHREYESIQKQATDARAAEKAQRDARRDEESWWKEKHDYQARAESAEAALATATAQLKAVQGRDKETFEACQHWIGEYNRTESALAAATARCGELDAKTLKWHKGPALGGEGTAGKNDEGVPQWYDGDRLLIIVETTGDDEMAIVDIIADEDLFQVKDATTGDTYDAWEPAQWSWWAKFNKHNLPSAAARPDAPLPSAGKEKPKSL